LILDVVVRFRDAETALAEALKRFLAARCALATSIAARIDRKKISLPCAMQIYVARTIQANGHSASRTDVVVQGARVEKGLQDRIKSARQAKLSALTLVAGPPDQKSECDDQNHDNQHPDLAFDAKNVKRLNEKLHGARPISVQIRGFEQKNILFIYSCSVTTLRRKFAARLASKF
jgi:hypothetical protein